MSACVAKIKTCKMGTVATWGSTDKTCSWFNTCDFAHLCKDCREAGPNCPPPNARCPHYYAFTSELLRASPMPPPPPPQLHFRGRANLDAVLDSLFETRGLGNATEVVFAGDSAGALAVWLNLDHVAERVRAVSPAAKVAGFADSGFFQDYPTFGSTDHGYTHQMKSIWSMASPTTNADCSAAWGNKSTDADGWKCYMAEYVSPFVETPIFDAEAMYDAWMIPNILQLGCNWIGSYYSGDCSTPQVTAFQDWGHHVNTTVAAELLRTTTAGGTPVQRGAFVTACIHHCQSMFMCGGEGYDRWSTLSIKGVSLRQAFSNFWHAVISGKELQGNVTKLFDDGRYPGGNPVCPTWDC